MLLNSPGLVIITVLALVNGDVVQVTASPVQNPVTNTRKDLFVFDGADS